jgi:hypothetical protein
MIMVCTVFAAKRAVRDEGGPFEGRKKRRKEGEKRKKAAPPQMKAAMHRRTPRVADSRA